MKQVIIIGSGIGGLCSAVRLLNKGYKVTILEKESTLGGKVNIKEEKDYKFDLTASILMTSKIYTDIFKESGKDYKDYFKLISLDPLYKVSYFDGSVYEFYSEEDKMRKALEVIEKGLADKYFEFLQDTINKYQITEKYFLEEPMLNISEVVKLKSINKRLKISPLTSAQRYISKYIKNEKLKEYLLFQTMYIGINPYKNSNIYTMIPAISHKYGLYYIEGGFYKYILALVKLINELGGGIKTNTKVEKILIDNKKVTGVKTGSDTYNSDIVICNADYSYALENLFDDKINEGLYTSKNVRKKKYSYSVFMIYLGLKKKYNELSVNNIYINRELDKEFTDASKGIIPCFPSMYIYYPSAIDKDICRGNKTALNIMVRVPNLSHKNIKWDEDTIKNLRNKIIKEVKKIKGLEDIEENIEYEDYLTPKDLYTRFNSYEGNAFGLSHKLGQSIYLRPHMKSKSIKGLYYIGASTHPGNGVSIIISGSKILCSIIDKDYK